MGEIKIIGISGRAEAGKDTVGEMIKEITNKANNWHIKKFGAKVKEVAHILTGIPVEKFEDQEFKKSLLPAEWGTITKTPLNSVPPFEHINFNALMTVREFLEKIGLALRSVHEDILINALWGEYKGYSPKAHSGSFSDENCYIHPKCYICGEPFYGYKRQYACKKCIDANSPIYPHWIITDVRLPNAVKSIRDRGGVIIRLRRNEDVLSDCILETALDDFDFDCEIDNRETSLEDLREAVEDFCRVFNII